MADEPLTEDARHPLGPAARRIYDGNQAQPPSPTKGDFYSYSPAAEVINQRGLPASSPTPRSQASPATRIVMTPGPAPLETYIGFWRQRLVEAGAFAPARPRLPAAPPAPTPVTQREAMASTATRVGRPVLLGV